MKKKLKIINNCRIFKKINKIRENVEAETITFNELTLRTSNLLNLQLMLKDKLPLIYEIKNKYDVAFRTPKTLLILFAFENTFITFDDNSSLRVLSLTEILDAKNKYDIDYVDMRCIPIVEYFNKQHIVYNLEERQYNLFDLKTQQKVIQLPTNIKKILDMLRTVDIRESIQIKNKLTNMKIREIKIKKNNKNTSNCEAVLSKT